MKIKIGIVITIILIVGGLLLTGMFGKLIGLAVSLAVWGATGYLVGKLTQGEGYGLIGNVMMGIVGGAVGSLLMSLLGWVGIISLPFGGVIAGVIGGVIAVLASRVFASQQAAE